METDNLPSAFASPKSEQTPYTIHGDHVVTRTDNPKELAIAILECAALNIGQKRKGRVTVALISLRSRILHREIVGEILLIATAYDLIFRRSHGKEYLFTRT